eukprot:5293050-Prymnesium_polylepis.1
MSDVDLGPSMRIPHTALLPLSPCTCAHESRTKVASPAMGECCETSGPEPPVGLPGFRLQSRVLSGGRNTRSK